MIKNYYPMLAILFLMLAPLAIVVVQSPVVAKDLREMIPTEHLARGGGWTWYGGHGSIIPTFVYASLTWVSGIPTQNSAMFLLIPFAFGIFLMIYIISGGLFGSKKIALVSLASFTLFPAYARLADMRPSILGILFAYYAIHIMLKEKKIPWVFGLITLLWSPATFFFLFGIVAAMLAVEYIIPSYSLKDRFIIAVSSNLIALTLLLWIINVVGFTGAIGKYLWSIQKDVGWVFIPMVAPFVVGYILSHIKYKHVYIIALILFCIPTHPWIYEHIYVNGFTAPDDSTLRIHGFPGEPGFSMYSYPVHAFYIVNRFDYFTPEGEEYPGVQFGDGMPELLDWFSQQPVDSKYVSLCMYYNNFSITFPRICENQDPVTLFEFIPKYSGVLPAVDVPRDDLLKIYGFDEAATLIREYDVNYVLVTANELKQFKPTVNDSMNLCILYSGGGYEVYGECAVHEPWPACSVESTGGECT